MADTRIIKEVDGLCICKWYVFRCFVGSSQGWVKCQFQECIQRKEEGGSSWLSHCGSHSERHEVPLLGSPSTGDLKSAERVVMLLWGQCQLWEQAKFLTPAWAAPQEPAVRPPAWHWGWLAIETVVASGMKS